MHCIVYSMHDNGESALVYATIYKMIYHLGIIEEYLMHHPLLIMDND